MQEMTEQQFKRLRELLDGRTYDDALLGKENAGAAVAAGAYSARIEVDEWRELEVYLTTADVAGLVVNAYFSPAGSSGKYLVKANRWEASDEDGITSTKWSYVLPMNGSRGTLFLRPSIDAAVYVRGVRR